jgi:arsenate reductase
MISASGLLARLYFSLLDTIPQYTLQERTANMPVEIYHNPRCSKSRQTLKLLEEQGVEPEIIEYLKTPPDKAGLKKILKMLGIEPRELMRKKEKEYKEAGLDNPDLSADQLIQGMIDHPRLIERPIVIKNGRAALGRPPEKVLDIL